MKMSTYLSSLVLPFAIATAMTGATSLRAQDYVRDSEPKAGEERAHSLQKPAKGRPPGGFPRILVRRPRLVAQLRKSTAQRRAGNLNQSRVRRVQLQGINRMAAETESAETSKLVSTVALAGANRPKLTKMLVSQKTTTISNGMETEMAPCAYCNQRVSPRLNTTLVA
jgi:hypothetical protein